MDDGIHRGPDAHMSYDQKVPFSRTLPQVMGRVARSTVSRLGLAIPGSVTAVSGAIVTVQPMLAGANLGPLTMPLASAQYLRLPIQVGDKGVAMPASFYLGAVSGLGNGGSADTSIPDGNLTALFWVPLGSKGWATVSDPNAVTIYGVGSSGVTLKTGTGNASITLTDNSLTLVCGGNTVTIDSSGVTIDGGKTVTIDSSGVTIDGTVFESHEHVAGTLVAPSGGGPVTGETGAPT